MSNHRSAARPPGLTVLEGNAQRYCLNLYGTGIESLAALTTGPQGASGATR